MNPSTEITGYYIHQERIYATGLDKSFQDDVRKATGVVSLLMSQNSKARAEMNQWAQTDHTATAYVITAVTLDNLTDPWFWITVDLMSRPRYVGSASEGCCEGCGGGSGSCGGCCSNCSGGGGGSGDTCIAILLVCAIGILVAAFAAAVGLTVSQGADAERARRGINEIKGIMREGQDERIRTVFNKVLTIQKANWASHSVKATFSAVAAGGIALLTASACLALYAVISKNPISPYASILASWGGGITLLSLTAHTVRVVATRCNESKNLKLLRELFNEIQSLGSTHPFSLLEEQKVPNATLLFGDYRYIKEENSFRKVPATERGTFDTYTEFTLPTPTNSEN